MAEEKNELLNYIKNTDNQFKIKIGISRSGKKPKEELVTSWLSQEFTFSLANNSQEVIDVAWLGKINQLKGMANIIGDTLSQYERVKTLSKMVKQFGDTVIFNKTISKLSWSSSQRLTFSLPMIFIAYDKTDDVRAQVSKLSSTVLPEYKDEKEYTMPIGFKSGTSIFVDIGIYMTVPDLIINSVDVVFSKQVLIESGRPLYALCNVSFSSRYAITHQDFLSYLKQDQS